MEKTGIAKMNAPMYEDMQKSGHLLTYYILESGYAGTNKKGTIVDRRIYPDAIPIQSGGISITPPKEVTPENLKCEYAYLVFFKQYSTDFLRQVVVMATDETHAEEKLKKEHPQACKISVSHESLNLIG